MFNKMDRRREQESPKSSLLFAAQAKHFERKFKRKNNSENTYTILPQYDSPKPGIRPINPFNEKLAERLIHPTCSPDVFSNVKSPNEASNEFHWTIEDISKINPAHIGSPISECDDIDDETERRAQEAIARYFSHNHNVTSPSEPIKSWVEQTPEQPSFDIDMASPYRVGTLTIDVAVQTLLLLPPDLPSDITDALAPYTSHVDDLRDDCNLSVDSLRRKHFFDKEDFTISPVRSDIVAYFIRHSSPDHNVSSISWVEDSHEHIDVDMVSTYSSEAPVKKCTASEPRALLLFNPLLAVAVQTLISFPLEVPEEVSDLWAPYISSVDDSKEDCNLSANTLRRKLFFNKEDPAISPVRVSAPGSFHNPTMLQNWSLSEHDMSMSDQSSIDISPIKLSTPDSKSIFRRNLCVDDFHTAGSTNARQEVVFSVNGNSPSWCTQKPSVQEAHDITRDPVQIFTSTLMGQPSHNFNQTIDMTLWDEDIVQNAILKPETKICSDTGYHTMQLSESEQPMDISGRGFTSTPRKETMGCNIKEIF